MSQMLAVLLVISGGSPTYHALEDIQRSMWAWETERNIRPIWLKGNHAGPPRWEDSNNSLWVDVPESFENIFLKTQEGIRWVLENWSPQFVVRTNNSSFWNFHLLAKQLEDLPTSGLYGGFAGSFEAKSNIFVRRSLPYVSGAGVWMSQDVAEIFSKADLDPSTSLIDDCYVGKLRQNRECPSPLLVELTSLPTCRQLLRLTPE